MAGVTGLRLGRYEVIKHLASGGMAELLLARTADGFEHHVVVKRIHAEHARDPQAIAMFLDEARLAASLHHDNIVQVHDVGLAHDEYFFAMEYVHGQDLRALLRKLGERERQLPLDHVVAIVCGVAAALQHAHDQVGPDRRPLGIVHRDVSPGNVLVGYDGSVKLVDFGIATATTRAAETRSGTIKGKVAYMSVEQCLGQPVDRRSDLFSLGIVLYELATVRRLFKGASDYLTMTAIVNGEIPVPSIYRPDLPTTLERIIMKSLASEPARRYQQASELRGALDDFARSEGLHPSNTRLAAFMTELFGTPLEPWLVDEPFELGVDDFDDSGAGLAPIAPDVELAASKTSPIVRARVREATAPIVDEAVPERPPHDRRRLWFAGSVLAVLATTGVLLGAVSTGDPEPTNPTPLDPVRAPPRRAPTPPVVPRAPEVPGPAPGSRLREEATLPARVPRPHRPAKRKGRWDPDRLLPR